MDDKVEFEVGKYYRKDDWDFSRRGEYFKVLDITHPDKDHPNHTVCHRFEITYSKFDACRINWGEEPAKNISGPSRFWGARRGYTLERFWEGGYVEVSSQEFEAVRNELIEELLVVDGIEGELSEEPHLWWGEKLYFKKLNRPTFTKYVPPQKAFIEVPETYTIKFGEWSTDICGIYLHRGYSDAERMDNYVPLDEQLFKQRRDALVQMAKEDINVAYDTGHYDFVPNPYREKR